MTQKPIVEAKVKTGALAAALTGLVLTLLSTTLFSGGPVPDALATVVTTVVGTAVSGAVTFAVGWLTRHTPRDVLDLDQRE